MVEVVQWMVAGGRCGSVRSCADTYTNTNTYANTNTNTNTYANTNTNPNANAYARSANGE
jgi:hypothetical protein